MSVCPGCESDAQVVRLADFWRSLSQDAEAKRSLAQPASYAAQWPVPAGLFAVGVLAAVNGAVAFGVVLLLAGVGVGVWMWQRYAAAEEARERWTRQLYCRRCASRFLPEKAL
jgi:hypothetical protein